MHASSPVSDAKCVIQKQSLGVLIEIDEMPSGDYKQLCIWLLSIAYARLFMNSQETAATASRKTWVWIVENQHIFAKSVSTDVHRHIFISDAVIGQLVLDAYRLANATDVFPWFAPNDSQLEAGSRRAIMEGVTPDALLQNLERYAAPGNARRRLATALASIGFVFVVDHEYQHLANQHAYLSSQSQPQQASPDYYLAMQALEMDADTYSINRWADMLLGDDRFLEGVGFTDVLDILQAQDRAAAYALFVYAMFCAFRGLGQKDWHGGFTFESRHPPAPFRFKIALVVLWDRLQKPASSHERKTYERLLPVVWPLMEFLYTHGSGNSPSMRSVDEVASPEATRHFEALYKRWHDLVSSGAVTGWHGIPPLE